MTSSCAGWRNGYRASSSAPASCRTARCTGSIRPAARQDPEPDRRRGEGRRPPGLRRRPSGRRALPQRSLVAADAAGRCPRRHAHRQRGDFRPGHYRGTLPRRGRGAASRQRHAIRPGGGGVDAGSGARQPHESRAALRHRLGQRLSPYFPEAPWGGFKSSGIGRELSRIGLDEYTELKHSYINLAPKPMGWFGA